MKKIFLLLSIIFLINCKKEQINLCDSLETTQESVKKNRKVLIIGIDGFRSDAMNASITPFMYNLSQSEEAYYSATTRTEATTSSGPNWSSLLTGVHQEKHLVINNGFTQHDLENYPHFMSYIEEANENLRTVSLVHWYPINLIITKDFADYAPVIGTEDSLIFQEANASLSPLSSSIPDVLFLHFDDLDHAGHAHGYHPDTIEYQETLSVLDLYAESLFGSIENRRQQGEDWMIFIVSDHGGNPSGDHSNSPNDPDVFNTISFIHHPSIGFTTDLNNKQVNLVPTVFDFLGIVSEKFDCYTDGKSLIAD